MSPPELSAEDRRRLLAVARRAIEAHLAGALAPREDVGGALLQPGGAFVTLRSRDGELRGCVGYVEPRMPLVEAVGRAAVAAAGFDERFAPVRREELARLVVEISALGPTCPIAAHEVTPGLHGVIVRHAGRSGLLLPQVATEHQWDRETFLDHTCRKAGLPPGAWREPGVEILAFGATVFGEDEE